MDTPFYLGQFLQLCDTLQKRYSIDFRNNGDTTKPIPGQLVGNTMLLESAERPVEALNRLMGRMKIYIGWVTSLNDGEEYKIAKWSYKKLRELSTKIMEKPLPDKLNTQQKAQLFLGYVSEIN